MSYNEDDLRAARPFSSENRPLWGLGFRWAAVIAGLLLVMTVIGFALHWGAAAVQVVSPENVRTQFSTVYGDYTSLHATACNVKQERALVAGAAATPDVQVQYQQQETAYEQNYQRIAAQYDEAYLNAFEAKHVGPADLPRTAPTLTDALTSASC